MNSLPHTITTSADLAGFAARLESAAFIGLDTEFLRERTYRAELCLVQIATADEALCVDPLALTDLSALAGPLAGVPRPGEPAGAAATPNSAAAPSRWGAPTAAAVKIMHASRQDLEVLYPAIGLVRPIFDTQIAAALTGMPAQVGYGELVRRALGVELSKSHTRTDWTRRPLSPEQIEYALDDVRYLLPLKQHLEAELDRLARLPWLAEELTALEDAQHFAPYPDQAWLRVKGLRGLDPPRRRLAQSLAAWRERRAIERNRPRGWILDDLALREIVLRVPRSLEALGEIPEMQPGVIKHCGSDILALIESAQIPDPPAPLELRLRPDPSQLALVKKLATINQTTAAELGLSPEILATRRDLEQLAEGKQDIPALHGWRRSVIGDKLLGAL